MKKRLLSCLLVVSMLIPLVGCKGSGGSGKLVLALRSGTYSDVIKECLPEFEKEHNVTCEVVELSEDDLHSQVLNDSVMGSGAYDICMVDGSWVAEYIYEDVLADLGELGYKLDDDIIPATTAICVQNGKTYLVPYYGNVTVMMYNRAVASELGYDDSSFTSLDKVREFCESSSAAGHGGFVYRGDTENNIVVDFLPILCAYGGWVVDENNNPTVNTPEFAAAMEYYMTLCNTGTALAKEDLISSIADGKMTTAVGWPGWYNDDEQPDSDFTAFPGRVNDSAESYNSNIYGIWTLGIPSNSVNKEEACELLKYLTDKEVQKGTVESGGVPCRYSSLMDPDILATNPNLAVICTALENGKYRPVMQEWPRFYTILGNEMKKMMDGSESVSDGLSLAQEALEAMMKGSEQ